MQQSFDFLKQTCDGTGHGVSLKKRKQRRYRLCQEEMEQGQGDKVQELAEVWDEVAVGVRAVVLGPARAATASVPSAGKKRPISRGYLAMSSDVPNATPR